ncbi:hypothetical protein [Acrocarpospora pleiomorpha]|uniref:hypothetical protein n=1 Tax=Acrocarpospora pleiomorpha TaxID=90975 RepID=UPI001478BE9B|nr:hypothetical protein [Acrocarpospora pleiomorpha]
MTDRLVEITSGTAESGQKRIPQVIEIYRQFDVVRDVRGFREQLDRTVEIRDFTNAFETALKRIGEIIEILAPVLGQAGVQCFPSSLDRGIQIPEYAGALKPRPQRHPEFGQPHRPPCKVIRRDTQNTLIKPDAMGDVTPRIVKRLSAPVHGSEIGPLGHIGQQGRRQRLVTSDKTANQHLNRRVTIPLIAAHLIAVPMQPAKQPPRLQIAFILARQIAEPHSQLLQRQIPRGLPHQRRNRSKPFRIHDSYHRPTCLCWDKNPGQPGVGLHRSRDGPLVPRPRTSDHRGRPYVMAVHLVQKLRRIPLSYPSDIRI